MFTLTDNSRRVGDSIDERMDPNRAGARIFWEHVARYRFAAGFVAGRSVLDVACGLGYGAIGLKRAGASAVLALDRDASTCQRVLHEARRHPVDHAPRIVRADALRLPLADAAVEVVVSFETLEHLTDPARFLDECVRVLRPGGRLIISTPNRPVYREGTDGVDNPHHLHELDAGEFRDLLTPRFARFDLYGQTPYHAPLVANRLAEGGAFRLAENQGILACSVLALPTTALRPGPNAKAPCPGDCGGRGWRLLRPLLGAGVRPVRNPPLDRRTTRLPLVSAGGRRAGRMSRNCTPRNNQSRVADEDTVRIGSTRHAPTATINHARGFAPRPT